MTDERESSPSTVPVAGGSLPVPAGDHAQTLARNVGRQVTSVWRRPDIRSALIVGPALLAIGLFDLMTGFVGSLFTGFVRATLYSAQGYLVARFVRQSDRHDASTLVRFGISGAVLAWLVSLVWALLCLAALGGMSGGMYFATVPFFFQTHLVSIIVNVIVTPIAAKIAFRHGGGRMALLLAGVAIAGMAITAAIAAILVGILVWIGVQVFS